MSGLEYTIGMGVVAEFFRPSSTGVTVLPTGTPLDGNDGAPGADGRTILNGAGAPSNSLGANGDFYIDVAYPPKLYGPKASGVWPAGVSMVGPSSGGGGGYLSYFLG